MLTTCVRRGTLLAAALATGLVTSLMVASGPAAAADPIFLNPSALPQGAAPAIPWFEPRTKVLHDGTRALTLSGLQGRVVELHKVDGGYLLGRSTSETGADLVFVTTTGARTLVTQQWAWRGTCDCVLNEALVDSDGAAVTFSRRLASGVYKDTLTVSLPARKIVRSRVFSSSPRLFEHRQGRVLLGIGDRLVRWTPRTNSASDVPSDGHESTAADGSAGQHIVKSGGSQTVRPLSSATGPSWSLDRDENPFVWSADGQHIAGMFEVVTGSTDNGFIVRRASDGQLVLVVRIPAPARIAWENNTTVLFPTDYESRHEPQLVRCTLAGECQRVGPVGRQSDAHIVVATRRSN